jgi:RHS repeat-associated protein
VGRLAPPFFSRFAAAAKARCALHRCRAWGKNSRLRVSTSNPRRAVFVSDLQTRIASRESGSCYDRTASGRLLYNYYRDYDPNTGRYGESDPIGLAGGVNTYAYGLNDPLLNSDPMGLDVYCINGSCVRTGPQPPPAYDPSAYPSGSSEPLYSSNGRSRERPGRTDRDGNPIYPDKPSDQLRPPGPPNRGEARCRCKAATNSEGGYGPSPAEWFYAERSGPTVAIAAKEACRQANKHIGIAYPKCQGEHCHCVCRDSGGPPYPYNPS